MPRLLSVRPVSDEWRVTEHADICYQEGAFPGREMALDWACRVALIKAPCEVRLVDDAGLVTAQFTFDQATAY